MTATGWSAHTGRQSTFSSLDENAFYIESTHSNECRQQIKWHTSGKTSTDFCCHDFNTIRDDIFETHFKIHFDHFVLRLLSIRYFCYSVLFFFCFFCASRWSRTFVLLSDLRARDFCFPFPNGFGLFFYTLRGVIFLVRLKATQQKI